MAWRITQHLVRGTLDNRQKGLVVGSLWFAGQPQPVNLELHGNFLRDLAGCSIEFENPTPVTGDPPPLDPLQVGMTGDMTASRKITLEAAPDHKANALYMEWFSETNGRVVIEATHYRLKISPPTWVMSAEDEESQIAANRQGFRDWLEHLSEMEDEDFERTNSRPDRPMNEFEWERVLKESDQKNERLGEVLEKYHGHPDSEKLIAREMGWTWVEEELEAQERGVFAEIEDMPFEPTSFDRASPAFMDGYEDEDDDEDDFDFEDELREPDSSREGIDWVRDPDGSIEHPVAARALQFSADLWREFEDNGLLGETGDSRIFEWVGLVESAGIRLSSTLGDVAFGDEVEPGFVVAGLKRAVNHLHKALELLQQLEPIHLIEPVRAKQFQQILFEFRSEIITLMQRYRQQG